MCRYKCLFGLHHYEIIQQEDMKPIGSNMTIGKVLISRCTDCGKIKQTIVKTIDNLYIG